MARPGCLGLANAHSSPTKLLVLREKKKIAQLGTVSNWGNEGRWIGEEDGRVWYVSAHIGVL